MADNNLGAPPAARPAADPQTFTITADRVSLTQRLVTPDATSFTVARLMQRPESRDIAFYDGSGRCRLVAAPSQRVVIVLDAPAHVRRARHVRSGARVQLTNGNWLTVARVRCLPYGYVSLEGAPPAADRLTIMGDVYVVVS